MSTGKTLIAGAGFTAFILGALVGAVTYTPTFLPTLGVTVPATSQPAPPSTANDKVEIRKVKAPKAKESRQLSEAKKPASTAKKKPTPNKPQAGGDQRGARADR